MKKIYGTMLLLMAATLMMESCKKRELFDKELYEEVITNKFPIEPIDAGHTWELSTRRTVIVRANAGMENTEQLLILTANPLTDSDAMILATQSNPEEGHSYTLLFVAPSEQTTFYAAVRTSANQYAVVPFTTSESQVNFNNKTTGTVSRTLSYDAFTYCFEETFPLPGDFDFNDCVMRMSVQPGSKSNQVRLTVTLAAVGASTSIAGAVRLKNYKYDDIESVEIEGGKAFDDGYPLTMRAIPDGPTFLQGRNGEPVIRLFEDAMWCLINEDADNIGQLKHYKVNVKKNVSADDESYKNVAARSRTYIITFKESASALLNNFLQDNLDPFIITLYNNNYWETHIYQDRMAQVLYEYHDQTSLRVTWALSVPYGVFRWPLENELIGSYKDGVLTGAYRQYNHSFGQWAAQKEQSRDWFYYPTVTEVY